MMPLRSPIPRTEVSIWVAPASRAQKALATAEGSAHQLLLLLIARTRLTASRIIVEVALDVAAHDSPQGANEVVHLAGVGAADSIGDSNASDSNLVDGAVDAEEVDEVGAERILRRKAHFEALGLDVFDNLDGGLDDVGDVLAVRVLAEERGGTDNHVDSVNACTESERLINSLVPPSSSTRNAPLSQAILASSMWQRMWVRILDLRPMLQILMQSRRLCSDAAGEVSSMYSTPKSESA